MFIWRNGFGSFLAGTCDSETKVILIEVEFDVMAINQETDSSANKKIFKASSVPIELELGFRCSRGFSWQFLT